MNKRVLIVDSGGRGHALAWKIKQSPQLRELFVAPGNGGTEKIATNIPIAVTDTANLLSFAKREKIDLTIVGQDDALAHGIVDDFRAAGLRIFGPSKLATEIESSKAFSKEMMDEAEVQTPDHWIFSSAENALALIRTQRMPLVIKADGLALGKGVRICHNIDEAQNAIADFMVRRIHGNAGNSVVIEKFVVGKEVSVHAFCDGKNFSLFPPSQDHKPIFDGDKGKNTGGMGTVAPLPWLNDEFLADVGDQVVRPILDVLALNGRKFTGCLYPGLKMEGKAGIVVLEFNARFGDPETQSYMRLLQSDLLEILEACVDEKLDSISSKIRWADQFACCVILASGGYPDDYKKGFEIFGIEHAEKIAGVVVFHSGTVWDNKTLRTTGGRVLGVTATGPTPGTALNKAYLATDRIHFEGMHFRTDLGKGYL